MLLRVLALLVAFGSLHTSVLARRQAGDQKPPPKQEQKSPARVEYERLYEAGKSAYDKADLNEAEKLWAEALKIADREKWEKEQGNCLNRLGWIFETLRQHEKALDHYQRSLELRDKVGNEQDIAASLNNIGNVYYSLGQYDKTLNHYQRSLKLEEKIGNEQHIASILGDIGNVYYFLGQWEKALDYYRRSLKLAEKTGNEQYIAACLSNMGNVYRSSGQYEKALDYYLRSQKLAERTGNEQTIAASLTNIGIVYRSFGQYDKALNHYQRSLKLWEKTGDEQHISTSLSNIGIVYRSFGQYNKALNYHQRALKLDEKVGNEQDIAASLNDIGIVYNYLGQHEKALDYYRRSLKLREKTGNEQSIASILCDIGIVYNYLGQHEKALDYYRRSLKLTEKTGNEQDTAGSLNNIGTVYDYLGQHKKALDYYRRSLKLRERIGNEQDIAMSLNNIGIVSTSLGQHMKAAKAYTQAVKLHERVSEQVGDPSELGAFQVASQGILYERLATLRVKQRSPADALVTLERGRAQGLSRQGRTAGLDLSRIMASADLTKLKTAEDAARAADAEYRASVERLEEATGEAKRFFQKQTAEAEEKRDKTERDWKLVRDALLANNKAYRNLVRYEHESIEQLRKLSRINPGTLFVEYGQLEDKLLILAMRDGKAPVGMTVSVKEKLLSQKAQKYRQAIQGNELEELGLAKELYGLAISPIERKGLMRGAKRMVFVPAGSLLEVPFAALADSRGKRLIERYAVSSAISLSTLLWPAAGRKPTESLLVIADPTGSGGEVATSRTRGSLGPLPGARKEGSQIYALQSGSKKMYSGESARESVVKSEIAKYAVLHFACHGSVNSAVPMTSCLFMAPEKADSAEDGFLEAREIMGIPLSAQLAVLSACETAQGVQSGGEGLMGLVWAFRAAGVPSVVASKWKVDDESTRRIMVKFYKELKRGKRKDDALRAAMLYEMKYPQRTGRTRDVVPAIKGKRAKPSNAYYWAAFQLIGEAGPLKGLPR